MENKNQKPEYLIEGIYSRLKIRSTTVFTTVRHMKSIKQVLNYKWRLEIKVFYEDFQEIS